MKPFRLWNCKRDVRKGIVVVNYEDLIHKGKEKLHINDLEEVKIVLENDGTIIDDNGYLLCLPDHTVLIMLQKNEEWYPHNQKQNLKFNEDVIDGVEYDLNLLNILNKIQNDFSKILFLNNTELELIININEKMFNSNIHGWLQEVKHACEKVYDQKREIRDTIDLVNLYHSAELHSKENETNIE